MTISTTRLPAGPITYSDEGSGPPIVFIHGLLVDGGLWSETVETLRAGHRCIVPELPLGSHRTAMDPQADLSPPGLAAIVAGLLEALDLEDVTLVGNDTGGAICQIVATRHPERLGRLVLTPCDAYEDFLPPAFRYLQLVARVPGGTRVLMESMRSRRLRRLPIAYGRLAKRPLPDALTGRWAEPGLADAGIRRDVTKVLRGVSRRHTLEAAEKLRGLEQPALLAWAPEDRFFKLENARRLAAAIPDARLELVEDSYTFVPIDQPQQLAALISEFVAATTETPVADRASRQAARPESSPL
jgi:pimeloyl-ACP methyl ester carboxylesterase